MSSTWSRDNLAVFGVGLVDGLEKAASGRRQISRPLVWRPRWSRRQTRITVWRPVSIGDVSIGDVSIGDVSIGDDATRANLC
jgi:hypothetical protein